MLSNKLRNPETHYWFHGFKEPGNKYCPRELTLDNNQETRHRKSIFGLLIFLPYEIRPFEIPPYDFLPYDLRSTARFERPFDFITYCWLFSYTIDDYSCLNCCISTKLSQIAYLIKVHILVSQHAKCDCRLRKVLWLDCVFWELSYITTFLKHYSFIKLLQIR